MSKFKTTYIIAAKVIDGSPFKWTGEPLAPYQDSYWQSNPNEEEKKHIEQTISFIPLPGFDS